MFRGEVFSRPQASARRVFEESSSRTMRRDCVVSAGIRVYEPCTKGEMHYIVMSSISQCIECASSYKQKTSRLCRNLKRPASSSSCPNAMTSHIPHHDSVRRSKPTVHSESLVPLLALNV